MSGIELSLSGNRWMGAVNEWEQVRVDESGWECGWADGSG